MNQSIIQQAIAAVSIVIRFTDTIRGILVDPAHAMDYVG